VASTSPSISPSNTLNHSVSDQITSIAGNAAIHDEKGNLTEYEINSKEYAVTYDLENRITKVDVNNSDVEYRYDAIGRQIIRKEGSTETAILWWGDSKCAEYEHSAGQTCIQNDIMSHPTALNTVIARAVEGSKFDLEFYHKNYLDHVYAVSDDTSNLTEHYRYTAFGEVTIYNGAGSIQTSTQINNSILWNTRRLDTVSGYYLYKYRHYDPALGRWPSRDPIEENGGVNLYSFVWNNPYTWYDEYGNKPAKIIKPETDKPFLIPEQVWNDIKKRADKDNAPWMDTMTDEAGVSEDKRQNICDPSILKYSKSIDNKWWREQHFNDESFPWCGCFANYILEENGYEGPAVPSRAINFTSTWCKTDVPIFGALVIYKGAGNEGHVGFVAGVSGSEVIVVGGNQDDKVQPKRYNRNGKIGGLTLFEYRYPCNKEKNAPIKGLNPVDYNGYNVTKIPKSPDVEGGER
jgi:uncharacterized protein (TIGR02594 family)